MSANYKMFCLFGWKIYITRNSLRKRCNTSKGRRLGCKKERLRIAESRCECCGIEIDLRCSLYHLLPVGETDRNKAENTRVVCTQCHRLIQKGERVIA